MRNICRLHVLLCCFACLHACFLLAHSPYGRAAYANVNGLDPASTYRSHQDDQDEMQYQQQQQQQQQDFGMAGHSPTRRMAPPPPSRSGGVEGTYQPRPPPPVPAEAMASLNIGLDKSGWLLIPFPLAFLPCVCYYYYLSCLVVVVVEFSLVHAMRR